MKNSAEYKAWLIYIWAVGYGPDELEDIYRNSEFVSDVSLEEFFNDLHREDVKSSCDIIESERPKTILIHQNGVAHYVLALKEDGLEYEIFDKIGRMIGTCEPDYFGLMGMVEYTCLPKPILTVVN